MSLDTLLADIASGHPSSLKSETDNSMNYTRFACWYRNLVTITLSTNKQHALEYLEQVHPVIQQSSGAYPAHEVQWLAVSAWNAGVEMQRYVQLFILQ
jgi:hypothetical protein